MSLPNIREQHGSKATIPGGFSCGARTGVIIHSGICLTCTGVSLSRAVFLTPLSRPYPSERRRRERKWRHSQELTGLDPKGPGSCQVPSTPVIMSGLQLTLTPDQLPHWQLCPEGYVSPSACARVWAGWSLRCFHYEPAHRMWTSVMQELKEEPLNFFRRIRE